MFEKYFALAGALVACVSSDHPVDITDQELLTLQAHVPEIRMLENYEGKVDFRVDHVEADSFALEQSLFRVRIQEPWAGKPSADFAHLFYGMARRLWLQQGQFPVHGACVGSDDSGYVLLVGPAGSGKTSVAMECAGSYGLQVYSGDKTLLQVSEEGDLIAIGGTKVMTVRQQDRERWTALADHESDSYHRRTFSLKPALYAQADKVSIIAIVLLQLNDSRSVSQRLSADSSVHTLYPYLMDLERADVLLNHAEVVFDGSTELAAKQSHIPRLARCLKQTPTLHVIGSLEEVCSSVQKLARDRFSSPESSSS